MLIPETVNVAVLPARSVAVPVTDWLAPSASVVEPDRVSSPDSAALPLKLTVTSALYQPNVFAPRSAAPGIGGAGFWVLMPVPGAAAGVTAAAGAVKGGG